MKRKTIYNENDIWNLNPIRAGPCQTRFVYYNHIHGQSRMGDKGERDRDREWDVIIRKTEINSNNLLNCLLFHCIYVCTLKTMTLIAYPQCYVSSCIICRLVSFNNFQANGFVYRMVRMMIDKNRKNAGKL